MQTVTYCPEDNKLRLYVGRVPRDEYERLRNAGFVSTPKQDCDFVATWTPGREDIAREYLDDGEDIGDEDYSPEERAADRAERFGGYRDKRAGEAGVSADTFDAGPAAFGHQNRARAERQAMRHDRHRVYAVSQWSKAEYWQERTAAVIGHALHRSSAKVRRGRILTLEAEQRKHEANRAEYADTWAKWHQVLTLPGADTPIQRTDDGLQADRAGVLAYTLANTRCHSHDYQHPRRELDPAQYNQGRTSLYSLLTDSADPITPREAATLWLDGRKAPDDPDSYSARWSAHYALRLEYERAMLDAEGGTAAECEMEPGGWIRCGTARSTRHLISVDGWAQILRVNRSPVTKRVTSVVVLGRDPFGYCDVSEQQKIRELVVNIERAGEDAYRPPTDAERAEFAVSTKARKAAKKASTPKTPPLVNPTDEDAERLQALLNTIAKPEYDKKHPERFGHSPYTPTEVIRMTQAKYSELSGGSYSSFETRTIHNAGGVIARRSSNMYSSEGSAYDKALGAAVCKLRIRSSGGWYNPPHIVILTDKPQKPLPLDWDAIEQPAEEVTA